MKQASSVDEIEPGAMVNLADLDTMFLVPCKSCGELLEEKDRFCPHCGRDQTATDGTGDEKSPAEPEGNVFAGSQPPALVASGFAIGQQETQPSTGRSAAPPHRLAIGIGAGLVALLVVALASYYFQIGDRSKAIRPPPVDALGAVVAPAREQVVEPVRQAEDGISKPPAAPVPASPAENGAASPAGAECSEVLAALALCTKR